jgi:hypothetical protein
LRQIGHGVIAASPITPRLRLRVLAESTVSQAEQKSGNACTAGPALWIQLVGYGWARRDVIVFIFVLGPVLLKKFRWHQQHTGLF